MKKCKRNGYFACDNRSSSWVHRIWSLVLWDRVQCIFLWISNSHQRGCHCWGDLCIRHQCVSTGHVLSVIQLVEVSLLQIHRCHYCYLAIKRTTIILVGEKIRKHKHERERNRNINRVIHLHYEPVQPFNFHIIYSNTKYLIPNQSSVHDNKIIVYKKI